MEHSFDQGVGAEIKRLREEREWSMAKLAVEADMSVSGVSMIENGKRNLTTTTLAKLARAFGVEVRDLFPLAQTPLPDQGEWRPSLRSWIDLVGRQVDRWESELKEREREWQEAKPAVRKNVKRLTNISWAAEITGTYVNIMEALGIELDRGLYVYELREVAELAQGVKRLGKIPERAKPLYQGEGSPRMAKVIHIERILEERVEKESKTRSSQST
jgi:transcriptional regulator with XRE-family HTH domain